MEIASEEQMIIYLVIKKFQAKFHKLFLKAEEYSIYLKQFS